MRDRGAEFAGEKGVNTIRIAIQGELGSFSHEAALRMFEQDGFAPELEACALSAEVFDRLVAGSVDGAVIPIENSLAGPVAEHYDLLLREPVRITRELRLRIRHNLIGRPGLKTDEVLRVLSHPVALAQCGRFLAAHPRMKAMPYYDTAGSVKQAMENPESRSAGIASAQAAAEYGGEILEAGIEDNEENYTRFHLVVRDGSAAGGRVPASRDVTPNDAAPNHAAPKDMAPKDMAPKDMAPNKLSVAFAVEHRPGTLVRALESLAGCGVDLTRIDSRPVPGRPWEYVFFADLRFTSRDMADAALLALKPPCLMVKELGRYVAAG